MSSDPARPARIDPGAATVVAAGVDPSPRSAPVTIPAAYAATVAPSDFIGAATEIGAPPSSRGAALIDVFADASFPVRYQGDAVIGEGGMGMVRACVDRRIGREVAVKVLQPSIRSREDLVARFLREACVQGQLEHPSIVPVYDVGRDPDGALYFTMKRVRGLTLEDIIGALAAGDPEATRHFTRHKLLSAFASVCQAVAFAHDRGVLHRDLKPANVMLGDFGEVYVLDWGIAKVVGAAEVASDGAAPAVSERGASAKTRAGTTMGTPGYMAPEQVRGNEVDARTDVYALGVILFELLALEPLHPTSSAELAIASTLGGPASKPSERARGTELPPELDALCEAATATDRDARTPSVRALLAAIERYLDGDRDLARRKELARGHLQAASEHIDRALAGGKGATAARSVGLREIGQAIALDPTDSDAAAILMRLMTEAPGEVPAEAHAVIEAEARRSLRSAARGLAIGCASIGAVLQPPMLWMGILSWPAYLLFTGAWMAAAVACYVTSQRPPKDGALPIHMRLTGVAIVATSATIFGPYIITPTLAIAAAILALLRPSPRSRVGVVALYCMAVVVPAALQALGILSPSYIFEGNTIVIAPRMLAFPAVPAQLFLLVANLTCIIAVAAVVSRIRGQLTRAEERMHVHAWQLRQLVPDQARAASDGSDASEAKLVAHADRAKPTRGG